MQPRDYHPPHSDAIVRAAGTGTIFGSLAAAANVKNGTWRLHYATPNLSGVAVYLDAVTGDILYIHDLPH